MYGCSYDHGGDDCDCRGSTNEMDEQRNDLTGSIHQLMSFMTSMYADHFISAGDLRPLHLILLSV